ncbi:diguanylate cyclase (GGDEF)-like protein [Sphaerotilus hippei]|uniref:diguanylate cyclase n=1 Tax=Sphaerotilus hippei TaxID=744406 RepID=A0A318H1I1_9BURK|nr:GGDEF domain-containing protein [Sphaerotilus hippei]PXW96255.1 diguanylate cyclase (GGDEF)-like protein [Sphaerotilus hippei]
MRLEAHDPPNAVALQREIARQFGQREFGAAMTSWLGFCLLAYTMRDVAPARHIALWLGLCALWESCNLVQSRLLSQARVSDTRRPRLLRGLTVTIGLDGLTWGLAPFLMAVPGNPPYLMLQTLYLACVCALSIQGVCMHRPAMLGFMVPLMLPLGIAHLLADEPLRHIMGLGCLIILALSLFYGIISRRLNVSAITAMVDNREMAATLQRRNGELRTALDTIQELAQRDPLTNALNRRALLERLQAEFARQDRLGTPVGLLLIDLDHFKRVNDQHGHLAGDDVLRATARRLEETMRASDLVARFGGEEFACVLAVRDADELREAARRVHAALGGTPFVLPSAAQAPITVTASVGAALRQRNESINALIGRVDRALYQAKAQGRDQVVEAP